MDKLKNWPGKADVLLLYVLVKLHWTKGRHIQLPNHPKQVGVNLCLNLVILVFLP